MSNEKIDITGLDKADVLAALYNASRPLGLGFLHYTPGDMPHEQAVALIGERAPHGSYFDYVQGRVIKVKLDDDSFDPWLYDRDNGQGAAERAVANVRAAMFKKGA